MKQSISERFLYLKENDALFAIPVIKSISFQSPMFGATYKTAETADKKRLFQIQVFETKAGTECLEKIDEENDRQVHLINETTKDELYGIVYDHVEKIFFPDSVWYWRLEINDKTRPLYAQCTVVFIEPEQTQLFSADFIR